MGAAAYSPHGTAFAPWSCPGRRNDMEVLGLQEGDQRLALNPQAWWQLCTRPSMPQDQEVKVIADCRQDVRWGCGLTCSAQERHVGASRALTCRVLQLSCGTSACHVHRLAALCNKVMQPTAGVPAWTP